VRFVRILAEWERTCLHLTTQLVRVDGQVRVRVLGPNGEPVPLFRRPAVLPPAQDGHDFDRAISEAVHRLTPDSGGREAWFQEARAILADQGSDALTIAALCQRIGVTKGSFHHHFSTVSGFVDAMAAQWESASRAVQDTIAAEPDLLRRIELICQAVLTLPHPMELAWRSWGWTNPAVGAAMRRVDNHGVQITVATLTELLDDAERAALLTEMGLGLALGLQQYDPPLDAETFALTILEWLRRVLGMEADLDLVDGAPRLVIHGMRS
jgi:AcrR family transcriptional regulator